MKELILSLLFLINSPVMAQMGDFMDDDIELGSDIFSDFSEDITQKEMAEDERFYRYGRFFSFEIGFGGTFFDGNRGAAYKNDPPSIGLQLNYFMGFNLSLGTWLRFFQTPLFY